jgi:competence ComEA-like helix-hairpin-helix protein
MSFLTPDERNAVYFLCLIAAAGAVARVVRSDRGSAPGAEVVAPHLPGQDIAAQAARSKRAERLAAPLEPGEKIDVNRASAQELERLPRVGPALAAQIVRYRERHGPIGSLAALDSVAGIGPAMLEGLASWVDFSGSRRP